MQEISAPERNKKEKKEKQVLKKPVVKGGQDDLIREVGGAWSTPKQWADGKPESFKAREGTGRCDIERETRLTEAVTVDDLEM